MESILLVKIGFLPISIWDLFDIFIVGYLFYVLYKLSKGSLAFNILIGVLVLSVIYWLVNIAEMSLLSSILGGLANFGFIVLVVVFQPEIRRFLIFLGQNFLKSRSNFINQFITIKTFNADSQLLESLINKIVNASISLAKRKTGALIVFTQNPELQGLNKTGVNLDSKVSTRLIESIFHKESPLHDGAMLITDGKIYAVGSILPVSESQSLPDSAGLRHRAAVGVSEVANVFSVIISEETGKISIAKEGKLFQDLDKKQLYNMLKAGLKKMAYNMPGTTTTENSN